MWSLQKGVNKYVLGKVKLLIACQGKVVVDYLPKEDEPLYI